MTKRAAIGETIMRKTRRATLCLGKPLFFGYNPSTATNYAENARKSEGNGPYGQAFAISMTFLRSMNLTGRKTAKNSNKGFQPTTHKLLARHTLSLATHRYGTVRGSRLTPDVGTRIYMATARTMDLRPLRRNDHDRAGMIWEAKPGTANENGCQQDVPPYAAQGAPKVNFNVGSGNI